VTVLILVIAVEVVVAVPVAVHIPVASATATIPGVLRDVRQHWQYGQVLWHSVLAASNAAAPRRIWVRRHGGHGRVALMPWMALVLDVALKPVRECVGRVRDGQIRWK
jgi:hypothetical protein